jgi:hypothetical protein
MSVVYNCCWSSPAQSFSYPSHAGLTTTFYCLRFETPPTWRARSPYLYLPGQSGPVITPGTGFLFRRLRHSVRTSQETHYVSATKTNRLILFRETVAVYCENHTKHINTLCGQNAENFSMLKQVVHMVSIGL